VRFQFIKYSDCNSALTEAIMNLVVEVNKKLNLMHLDQKSFILGQENRTRDKESQEILDWLSPLNFWNKQNDTIQKREPGTGEWLLNDPLFLKWLDGTNRILWCQGERMYPLSYASHCFAILTLC
jgi:hypothetical protein